MCTEHLCDDCGTWNQSEGFCRTCEQQKQKKQEKPDERPGWCDQCGELHVDGPCPLLRTDVAKEWKPWDVESCPECGDTCEVLTAEVKPGYVRDGDKVRCVTCHSQSSVSCDTENPPSVNWD